ncbi:MAG: thiamine-monophosphate kinase, partial [Planctomycetaceae bacterium]|nr:thiamine-monophosphate kinase [Planctomycetaceae bacterium]
MKFSDESPESGRQSDIPESTQFTENAFLQHIQRSCPVRRPVQVGIGDDGAVLAGTGDAPFVVVTDMLLDGVHFELGKISPDLAGRKAVAVNLSDLAAMGCRPTACFLSLAMPRNVPGGSARRFLQQLYDGILPLAERYGFTIAGGDTNAWNGPFAINVCLTGEPVSRQIPLRSGARIGDIVLVSGQLGGSLASGRHLTFEPRLELAEWLLR